MLYSQQYESPLGPITLLADETYLYGLWFNGQTNFGSNYDFTNIRNKETKPIKLTISWLDKYFNGKNPDPTTISLKPEVTPFRQEVLHILISVPYGETITYKEISDKLQVNKPTKTNLARAVGGAVGHNPIAIIIPCHRVVGSDGSLTGYAGGLVRKQDLLNFESGKKIPDHY